MSERVVDFFELPRESLLNVPKMVLVGNNQLVVENHLGILEYTSHRIRVATARGEVAIEGRGLSIARIVQSEISVEGHIERLKLWA